MIVPAHPSVAAKRRGILSRLRGILPTLALKKHNPTAQKNSQLPYGYFSQAYMVTPGKPLWTARDYSKFADEAYIRNVIAFRSINMIADGASNITLQLHRNYKNGQKQKLKQHPVLSLLATPNPAMHGTLLLEHVFSYYLISGNAYLQMAGPKGEPPHELHALRPDRVAIIPGNSGMAAAYRYTVGNSYRDYAVDPLTGRSRILHFKSFHPMDDWYGLSPIEAAAYSIDQHNEAGAWNQSLLQNGARPSGALVVKAGEQGGTGNLSEEQYWRIKQQIDDQFSGPANAGRPLLLEGGLDWREMSINPKDMDFINTKNSSARDIALAFGVPPQLIGIPGDNTYSNLAEARLALWEQTILPLADSFCVALNSWLMPLFGNDLTLSCDTDSINALSPRREKVWDRIEKSTFLTMNEKRTAMGFGSIEGGDRLA